MSGYEALYRTLSEEQLQACVERYHELRGHGLSQKAAFRRVVDEAPEGYCKVGTDLYQAITVRGLETPAELADKIDAMATRVLGEGGNALIIRNLPGIPGFADLVRSYVSDRWPQIHLTIQVEGGE